LTPGLRYKSFLIKLKKKNPDTMKFAFFLHLLINLWSTPNFVNGQQYLYDISKDPNEKTNLFNLPDYKTIQSLLLSRYDFFDALKRTPQIQAKIVASVWKAIGGAVPWLDYSNPPTLPAPVRKQAVASAPHIVFIMIDDVSCKFLPFIFSSTHCLLIFLCFNKNSKIQNLNKHKVGWSDIGFSAGGSSWAGFATPRIDAMAAKGVKLSNHYTTWVGGFTIFLLSHLQIWFPKLTF
jgi:hypothetical protein